MKWVLCICVIVALSANTAFARGGRLFHRGGSGSGSTTASLNAPVDKSPVYEHEHKLLNAINAIREKYGLRALVLDIVVLHKARQHCGWMANQHSMIHCANRCENIAMGQADVDDVVAAWMSSSGHRANILNPGYTKAGFTGYASPSGAPFWCQQFE
jgi:uncharacterized protein YkwD